MIENDWTPKINSNISCDHEPLLEPPTLKNTALCRDIDGAMRGLLLAVAAMYTIQGCLYGLLGCIIVHIFSFSLYQVIPSSWVVEFCFKNISFPPLSVKQTKNISICGTVFDTRWWEIGWMERASFLSLLYNYPPIRIPKCIQMHRSVVWFLFSSHSWWYGFDGSQTFSPPFYPFLDISIFRRHEVLFLQVSVQPVQVER